MYGYIYIHSICNMYIYIHIIVYPCSISVTNMLQGQAGRTQAFVDSGRGGPGWLVQKAPIIFGDDLGMV